MDDEGSGVRSFIEKHMLWVVILVIVAVMAVAFAVAGLTYSAGPDVNASGRMYVSSSGDWNGTDTAEYQVSLEFKDGEGMLTVSYLNGTFDPVENNTLRVFSITNQGDEYSLNTEAGLLQFVQYTVNDDDILNGTATKYYAALWSNERNIGLVDPALFGMPQSYLVAIVLKQQ
jgi:hypothetical protein